MVKNPSRIALRVHHQQIVMKIIKLSSGHCQILTSTYFEHSNADSNLKCKGVNTPESNTSCHTVSMLPVFPRDISKTAG
jgi:hypothetical protein